MLIDTYHLFKEMKGVVDIFEVEMREIAFTLYNHALLLRPGMDGLGLTEWYNLLDGTRWEEPR